MSDQSSKGASLESDLTAKLRDLPGEKSAALAEILEAEDPEEKADLIAIIQRISMSSSPVPPPEILEGYEKAVKGGGEWLLKYTKEEQKHRHDLNRLQLRYYSLGQIYGFVLGLFGIGGGLFLASQGAQWFGFVTFFTTLLSLVGLFVYNKSSENKKS